MDANKTAEREANGTKKFQKLNKQYLVRESERERDREREGERERENKYKNIQ